MDRFIANCSTRTPEVEGPLKSNMDRFIELFDIPLRTIENF